MVTAGIVDKIARKEERRERESVGERSGSERVVAEDAVCGLARWKLAGVCNGAAPAPPSLESASDRLPSSLFHFTLIATELAGKILPLPNAL